MNQDSAARNDGVKQRILDRSDIAQVIGEVTTLEKKFGHFIALCPFHQEKTPSFHVFSDHYHCFGCSAHGDIISFIQNHYGLGFRKSLQWLADKFNVDAPELVSPQFSKQQKIQERLNKAMTQADLLFKENLHSAKGELARSTLIKRGFSEDKIREFGFGYADPEFTSLTQTLQKQGFSIDELNRCSLVTHLPNKTIDFFRHRLIVPIRNRQGKLLGFGGRALKEDEPQKYKNSRYDKRANLFGLDRAHESIRRKSRAIVVEGYFDALQCWQNGLTEAVACQGTAVTREHLKQLSLITKTAYLLFDGDQAGRSASLKLLELAFEFPDIRLMVARLPDGEDPDSFITNHGPERLEELLSQSVEIVQAGVEARLREAHASSLPQLIDKTIGPWIKSIPDQLSRSVLIQKSAERLGIQYQEMQSLIQNSGGQPKLPAAEQARDKPSQSTDFISLSVIQKEILCHLFCARHSEVSAALLQEIQSQVTFPPPWDLVLSKLAETLSVDSDTPPRLLPRWKIPTTSRFETYSKN